MDRRSFLKYSAAALLGLCLSPVLPEGPGEGIALAQPTEAWKPPIRKWFLKFTEYERRPATELIVIHHTGFPRADKDSAVAAIHRFHQDKLGWVGVGYHYLIRKDGRIERGRLPDMMGAHALHYNQVSVGVCLAGNFDIGRPTVAQMCSVKELAAWLCQKYRLSPDAVVGHRDLNRTGCPGRNLYSRMDDIRRFCRDS